ncbi:MAG: RnfABCDGE type electron transport complex subunit G [Lachnospiraceae bacterium]|nr:RnfABCDGE type electron transport complex subunit G [Lachnospiraceae bacterium]
MNEMSAGKDIRIMLKEAFTLFAITLIAGLLLGFIYQLTKDPIAEQEALAVQNACRSVFSTADSFKLTDLSPSAAQAEEYKKLGVTIGEVYEALDASGNFLGYVLRSASNQGYGGDIVLYLGVASDGTLRDVSILEISETAGLGMNAESVLVPQFHEKSVPQFSYTKTGAAAEDEIDAISGATITTRAFVNAVNCGLSYAIDEMKGGAGNE